MFFNVSEIMDHTRYAYIYIFTPMTATYINTINNVCHKTHTRAHLREIEKKKYDTTDAQYTYRQIYATSTK